MWCIGIAIYSFHSHCVACAKCHQHRFTPRHNCHIPQHLQPDLYSAAFLCLSQSAVFLQNQGPSFNLLWCSTAIAVAGFGCTLQNAQVGYWHARHLGYMLPAPFLPNSTGFPSSSTVRFHSLHSSHCLQFLQCHLPSFSCFFKTTSLLLTFLQESHSGCSHSLQRSSA